MILLFFFLEKYYSNHIVNFFLIIMTIPSKNYDNFFSVNYFICN